MRKIRIVLHPETKKMLDNYQQVMGVSQEEAFNQLIRMGSTVYEFIGRERI